MTSLLLCLFYILCVTESECALTLIYYISYNIGFEFNIITKNPNIPFLCIFSFLLLKSTPNITIECKFLYSVSLCITSCLKTCHLQLVAFNHLPTYFHLISILNIHWKNHNF
ncbi:Protein of unknown function [Gryllus bimaculatus]|nr:Protein of unknown function [Gryllus bimaculatus]